MSLDLLHHHLHRHHQCLHHSWGYHHGYLVYQHHHHHFLQHHHYAPADSLVTTSTTTSIIGSSSICYCIGRAPWFHRQHHQPVVQCMRLIYSILTSLTSTTAAASSTRIALTMHHLDLCHHQRPNPFGGDVWSIP